MTLDKATEAIREKVGEDCGLDAKVKFLLDGQDVVYVDATQSPNTVSNEDQDADTTIKLTKENFEKILNGDMNPMTAFMMGKVKVEGNMGVAMNINKIL
jgi:putative sterol carrier protein